MKKVITFIASGFGLGYSPIASGTVGSLLGIPIIFFLCQMGVGWQVAACVGLVVVAVPICGIAEEYYDTRDDGRIVADEFMTLPICMIGLPWSPWMVIVAFLTCRFFDILKPPPAKQAELLYGGLGIVMDDVLASLYSLAVNHLIWRFAWPYIAGFLPQ